MSGGRTWDRVDALFHEALELTPVARTALLARVAAEDPALADEVRSLLASHEEASRFLETPPGLLRPQAPPERIGPYRIVEEIGHGGMGVVYRAVRDDEHFQKEVAIKLIDPGLRSDEILRRFRAERQILAMLDHPNIARLIDGGTAPDGSPYLVMEYVAGRTLIDYCDQEKLGIDDRLRLFLTVCDAVQFAHQRLVVHRDLKSDNILVIADGSPRLLDFGIAKLISPESGAPAGTVTAPLHRAMTPDYASPEQVRGDPVTVASDVYSLGVVLYELLAGERPLRFQTRTPEEILRVVTQDEPALPSAAITRAPGAEIAAARGDSTRRLRKRLSGDLDYIVLKALEKDPARRYGSVDQLAQDLRRHLDGLPVLARGQSTAYRTARFVRRHRVAVMATVLVGGSLIAGLAGTAWQAGVAGRERDRANRRFGEVRSLAHAVMFDIHDAIANLPGSTKAREILVQQSLRYLDGLRREAKGDLDLQHELAIAYAKIGDVQGRPMFPNLGQTQAALESYGRAMELLREVSAAQPDSIHVSHDLVVVAQRRSDLLVVMGRRDQALKEALAARDRIRAEMARHPGEPLFETDLAVTSSRLSDQKLALGDTLGSIADCAVNAGIAEASFRAHPDNPGSRRAALIAYTKMAGLRAIRGDRDSALQSFLRAEQLAQQAVAARPDDSDALRDLSIVYGQHALFLADGGQVDSALAVYDLGMKIAEQLAARDTANALQQGDLASGHYEIGTIMMKAKRWPEAEARFHEAFDRYARLAIADTGNVDHRLNLAHISQLAGDACRNQAAEAASARERGRWRGQAAAWYQRSLEAYSGLGRAGLLVGEDAAAPAEVTRLLAEVKKGG